MTVFFSALLLVPAGRAQQVIVDRVELMPNLPTPYDMRDWKEVARGYDAFVFDFAKTGTYLPLGWKYSSTVNYPSHASFGLDTVVGTPREQSAEAINVLPAVVGATLVGINKSDQAGENWVLMAEEYFNRRPEENVYLNNPTAQSGGDWWYDTMPNVFFYQLRDLYPGTGDFDFQFTSVADRWLAAVEHMGGSVAPWRVPNMNYRAWALSTMTGSITGVKEPESAGAIAWILYNAFAESGDHRYRLGAEWAMEYLSSLTSNPSYELQLPYGAYAAARMNAELGTGYDVAKIVNWTFDVGPLRSWGALLGNWGGYDISGLIGEDSSNDYAFLMNGFQQAAALVPMVRYDDRFARAIGKWVLNVANASRLYYPKYLPAANQDSEEWSVLYDPESYIGHEAIRQTSFGQSPYATGDAISGGWGATNLALYGSSHVGYLAGLVDTTSVRGVLEVDVLKTDFYRAPAFATHLYFNPYASDTTISVDLGASSYDLYDLVSNQFVVNGASGETRVSLPADNALLLARLPTGSPVSVEDGRMLVDGIVVDHRSGQLPTNLSPRIKSLGAGTNELFIQDSTNVYCTAEDHDDATLTYEWSASSGLISGDGPVATWVAPDVAGVFDIACAASDGRGGAAADTLTLSVISNHRPLIDSLRVNPSIIDVLETAAFVCSASDEDGDALTYEWQSLAGGSVVGSDAEATFTAPDEVGYYPVRCTVRDTFGAETSDSLGVVVGSLVADLRFTGNGLDVSGMNNHAAIVGQPVLVEDRDGNASSAFLFDGVDDALVVQNHPTIAFDDAVSVSFWVKPVAAPDRESFLVSHGSWQDRWKLSLTPDQVLRWTINTTTGITDLDAPAPLLVDSTYHVAATYGDGEIRLYKNGRLDESGTASGSLGQTSHALSIAQMLPGDTQYNFAGVIDDVQIYNRVLNAEEVLSQFDRATAISEAAPTVAEFALHGNYPNPFSVSTTIPFSLPHAGRVNIEVYDMAGRRVGALLDEFMAEGTHLLTWIGQDASGAPLSSGVYVIRFESGGHVQFRKMTKLPGP